MSCYPSCRYRHDSEPRLVHDETEDLALTADGWVKDPSGLPPAEPAPAAPIDPAQNDLQAQLAAMTQERDELSALIDHAADSLTATEAALAAVTKERDLALQHIAEAKASKKAGPAALFAIGAVGKAEE
jgi:hypothetical protein